MSTPLPSRHLKSGLPQLSVPPAASSPHHRVDWFPTPDTLAYEVGKGRRVDGTCVDQLVQDAVSPPPQRQRFRFEEPLDSDSTNSLLHTDITLTPEEEAAVTESSFAQALASTRVRPQNKEAAQSQSKSVDSTPLPSPALARGQSAESAAAASSLHARLPPRIPSVPSQLSRGSQQSQSQMSQQPVHQRGVSASSVSISTPQTPSAVSAQQQRSFSSALANPYVPSNATTTHAQSVPSTPSPFVPSIADLVSPAEALQGEFHSWSSPIAIGGFGGTTQQQQPQRSVPLTVQSVPTTPTMSNATIASFPLQQQQSSANINALLSSSPGLHHSSSPALNESPGESLSTLSPAWQTLLARQESIDHVRQDPEVHRLIAEGVPPAARPMLWKLLSGSTEERRRFPKGYYTKLLALHRLQGSAYDDEIRRDLARTLPGVDLFNPRKQPPPTPQATNASGSIIDPFSNSPSIPANGTMTPLSYTGSGGLAKLNRVLCAYATRNRSLGYCQGMNHLAGTLLTLLDEESSFWILVILVESRIGLYCKSMCGLEVDQLVFSSLVSYYLPKIHDHLRQYDVSIASFTVSWFVCLFVEAPLTRLEEIYQVWDHLLLRGDEFQFTMALTLLRVKESEILRKKDTGELLEFLLHSGFKHGSNNGGAAGGGGGDETPHHMNGINPFNQPLDISRMLRVDIPSLGSLAREISSLREYHRNAVLKKSKVLHTHAAQRLAETYKFPSVDTVQRLWNRFLEPSPWSILLHGSLTSTVKFYDSFCVEVFPESVRMKWRDCGLFSGLVERLFRTIDSEKRGEIPFESFLAAVSLFTRTNAEEERCRFAFRFYDVDGDGSIGREEMGQIFRMFHRTYNGAQIDSSSVIGDVAATGGEDASASSEHLSSVTSSTPPPASATILTTDDSTDVSALFVTMMFSKAADLSLASTQNSNASHASVLAHLYQTGLSYSLFRRIISLHPFSQQTFGLSLSESRSIVKHHSSGSAGGGTLPAGGAAIITSIPSTPVQVPRLIASVATVPAASMPPSQNGFLLNPSDRSSPAISQSPPLLVPSNDQGLASLSRRGSFNSTLSSTTAAFTAPLTTGIMPTTRRHSSGLAFMPHLVVNGTGGIASAAASTTASSSEACTMQHAHIGI